MVFVNVQNQVLSARATVRKANKKHSISKQFKEGVLFCFLFVCFFTDFQSKETAQKSTNPRVNQLTVSTPLNLIICLPLMYSVTKQRTVEDGLCSRRDWTARLISMPFTTRDQENDDYMDHNCAIKFKGAWWYRWCHRSNLNGLYLRGSHSSSADGVNWFQWKGYHYSLKRTEMKIRPKDF